MMGRARNSSCKGSGVAWLGLIMGRELGILDARGVSSIPGVNHGQGARIFHARGVE